MSVEHVHRVPTPDPFDMSLSLGSVLSRLGHDCPGACDAADTELGAPVWFVRSRVFGAGPGDAALVVLDSSDFGCSITRSRQLLRQINDCTRAHGIRVSERRVGDEGHALANVRALQADESSYVAWSRSPMGGAAS
jgi:hypothetical protein